VVAETRSLHRKLAQVMYEAERIPKRGRAPAAMGGFEFVQVGDAADVIRKALAEHNISMIPTAIDLVDSTEHQTSGGKSMTTVTVRTTWTLTDGDSGESTVIQSMGSGGDMGDKAIPKAQSSAMKYALLMGFLLSTGDDPEQTDTSDRRPKQDQPTTVTVEPIGPDGSLIGTVEAGKPPVDMDLRQTPDGAAWGFKLKAGNKGYQALAIGPLAEALAILGIEEGTRVQCWGDIVMVPWRKGDKDMPPYARINLTRVTGPDFDVPAAEALPVPIWPDADEAAEIAAAEAVSA
jgi:hypothetical protein